MSEESATEPPFEDAVRQLEEIVESLERGEPDLAAALSRYETGVRLLGRCYAVLERAERAVAILTGEDAEGNPVSVPFDASATTGPEEKDKPKPSAVEPTPAPPSKPSRARKARPIVEPDADLDPPF